MQRGSPSRLYAVLWLHTVRTRRLAWNLVDYMVSMSLWAAINSLMIIAIFGVRNSGLAVVVVPWVFYTTGVGLTAGWINYYTATGMPEYELHTGHNPLLTVAGRIITASAAATPPALIAAIALHTMFHVNANPVALAAASLAALLVGHSYSLLITAVGASQGIPGSMLDLFGYASSMLGGLLLPLRYFPQWLRELALATPLAPLGEATRAAVNPAYTWLDPGLAWKLLAAWIAGLYAAAYIASRRYAEKARREGVKTTRF